MECSLHPPIIIVLVCGGPLVYAYNHYDSVCVCVCVCVCVRVYVCE